MNVDLVGLIISYTPPVISSPTVANFRYNARWRVYDWRADRLTKLEIRGKSQRVALPPMTQGLLEQRSSNFNRRRCVTAVMTRLFMLRSPHTLWNASAQNMLISPIGAKIDYHSNGLERSQKGGLIDHAYSHVYSYWKFGKDRSSTFWDNCFPRGLLKRKQHQRIL